MFTTPHKDRVDGFVTSTKPLSYQGTLIDGIRVRFEAGRIVEAEARTGGAVLAKVLETDAGARQLGEVALVPASSAISASGLLFYNTLYDENAASHIALGQGFPFLLDDDDRERSNESKIHIDFMIGSNELTLTGITPAGDRVPVLAGGSWQL